MPAASAAPGLCAVDDGSCFAATGAASAVAAAAAAIGFDDDDLHRHRLQHLLLLEEEERLRAHNHQHNHQHQLPLSGRRSAPPHLLGRNRTAPAAVPSSLLLEASAASAASGAAAAAAATAKGVRHPHQRGASGRRPFGPAIALLLPDQA